MARPEKLHLIRGDVALPAFFPDATYGSVRCVDSGDLAEARRLHYKTFTLARDMLSLATNPIPVKAAMQMLGRDTGFLRMPMTTLEPELAAKLKKTLADYGLI